MEPIFHTLLDRNIQSASVRWLDFYMPSSDRFYIITVDLNHNIKDLLKYIKDKYKMQGTQASFQEPHLPVQ